MAPSTNTVTAPLVYGQEVTYASIVGPFDFVCAYVSAAGLNSNSEWKLYATVNGLRSQVGRAQYSGKTPQLLQWETDQGTVQAVKATGTLYELVGYSEQVGPPSATASLVGYDQFDTAADTSGGGTVQIPANFAEVTIATLGGGYHQFADIGVDQTAIVPCTLTLYALAGAGGVEAAIKQINLQANDHISDVLQAYILPGATQYRLTVKANGTTSSAGPNITASLAVYSEEFTSSAVVTLTGDVIGPSNNNRINDFQGLNMTTLEGTGGATDADKYTDALATGQSIFVESKTYDVAGHTGNLASQGQSLMGNGGQSILKDLANQPIIQVDNDEEQIRSVLLFGTFGAGANNHGIDLQGFCKTIVSDVYVHEPGGAGLHYSVGNVANAGPTVSNLRVYVAAGASGKGIYCDKGEYLTAVNCSLYGGTVGVHNDGGNNKFIGVSCENNTTGWLIDNSDTNGAHQIVVACSGNHNTHAIVVKPNANGVNFHASHFYYGDIQITGTDATFLVPALVSFFGDNIDVANTLLTDGAIVQYATCVFPMANANTITQAGTSSKIIFRPDCLKLDGTAYDPGGDYFQLDVADGRALNVRWSKNGVSPVDVVRSHWEGSHGRFWAGQGTTEAATVIGNLPGSESAYAAIWALGTSLQCGTAPTATNPWAYCDGANLSLNAPHTLGFGYIQLVGAGSTVMAKYDNLNDKSTFNQAIYENERDTSGADAGQAGDVEVRYTALGTYQLPDPTVSKGRVLWITTGFAAGAGNAVTLVRNGAETINGAGADLALTTPWHNYRITCNGTNWVVS